MWCRATWPPTPAGLLTRAGRSCCCCCCCCLLAAARGCTSSMPPLAPCQHCSTAPATLQPQQPQQPSPPHRRNFSPSPGRLRRYIEPTGHGVRVDSGVREGDDISTWYDPMISKLVAQGPDRPTALRTLGAALEGYVTEGPVSNLLFLRSILNQPAFAEAGDYSTSFIGRYYAGANGLKTEAFPLSVAARQELLALAAYLHVAEQRRLQPAAGGAQRPGAVSEHRELVVSEHDVHTEGWTDERVVVRPASEEMVGAAGVAAGAVEVEVAGRVVQVQPDVAGAAALWWVAGAGSAAAAGAELAAAVLVELDCCAGCGTWCIALLSSLHCPCLLGWPGLVQSGRGGAGWGGASALSCTSCARAATQHAVSIPHHPPGTSSYGPWPAPLTLALSPLPPAPPPPTPTPHTAPTPQPAPAAHTCPPPPAAPTPPTCTWCCLTASRPVARRWPGACAGARCSTRARSGGCWCSLLTWPACSSTCPP
jgi:hypothetical protein